MRIIDRTRIATTSASFAALLAGGLGMAHAQDFDLDALIEAARAEPQLTVFDSTGKIKTMAEAFSAKYGIDAVGTKMKAPAQIEMFDREARAGNVQADVAIISDASAVIAQLIPTGAVTSWSPPDLADKIDPDYQNPLVVVASANLWTYNTELYDSCPVSNIWQLTESEWKGKVAMQDPLRNPGLTNWFNQLEMHHDDKIGAAYEAQYGKPLDSDAGSATKAWLKALGQNAPLLGSSDSAAAESVGAPGQSEGFMGLMASAKYRDNADSDYKLGLCDGIKPFVGFTSVNVGVIATGSDSPNAAKLFLHYAMTPEGIAPQNNDGKMSSNSDVGLPADEASGVGNVLDQVQNYRISTAADDWETRQDWQDFWLLNYSR
ncbi:iron(III) transport system substrate-binding protein [Litoreibacter halocynthiae]|uniref:Iron(III) transport system substrate-binding protein n=1 Tax=Litoreibacter halocynthiae TaxID=1242689 RepID=A0A4R7LEG3_9RHOB|nr:ABC transporter substrate-binding protein [Litoreibacter halocynthiae]TDT74018.1 iron(III) transport system substrate-binding protein [Litoreibacter halocynthiae]